MLKTSVGYSHRSLVWKHNFSEGNMRKITDGIYQHRGYMIIKDEQGIWVENHLYLFKTWNDAREFINQLIDGINKKEPVIVGEWKIV